MAQVSCSSYRVTVHDDVIKWKHFPRYWPFVRGIHRSPVNFPTQRPVTRSFDVFFDLCLNKRLSKQSRRWRFETLSCPLWRHCGGLVSQRTGTCDNRVGRHVLWFVIHYSDVIMSAMASQITSLTIVYSTVYSGADQRKHQSFASLAFVWGIHRSPVNSPHKGPVTRKMFLFDDVIIQISGVRFDDF